MATRARQALLFQEEAVSLPLPIAGENLPRPDKLASLGALAVGVIMLAGSLIDLTILWGLQRQPTAEWEYVAVANTLEAFPRVLIALAFLYAALYFRRTTAMLGYRLLAGGLLGLGLLGAMLGVIDITSYLALVKSAPTPEAALMMKSIALKAGILSTLYVAVLVPCGILGFRRPRR